MAHKIKSAFVDDEQENILRFDPAPEFMDDDDAMEDVEHKVKQAQEQLEELRLQKEEIEKHKRQLEELRLKKERFASGKKDLLEKLAKATNGVDRELYDAQKLVEELSFCRDSFSRHLEVLRGLQPEKWNRSQVDHELDQALAAIEDAEDDFTKGIRRLAACRRAETLQTLESVEENEFSTRTSEKHAGADELGIWMRRGFAFTLPLVVALFLTLILARMIF